MSTRRDGYSGQPGRSSWDGYRPENPARGADGRRAREAWQAGGSRDVPSADRYGTEEPYDDGGRRSAGRSDWNAGTARPRGSSSNDRRYRDAWYAQDGRAPARSGDARGSEHDMSGHQTRSSRSRRTAGTRPSAAGPSDTARRSDRRAAPGRDVADRGTSRQSDRPMHRTSRAGSGGSGRSTSQRGDYGREDGRRRTDSGRAPVAGDRRDDRRSPRDRGVSSTAGRYPSARSADGRPYTSSARGAAGSRGAYPTSAADAVDMARDLGSRAISSARDRLDGVGSVLGARAGDVAAGVLERGIDPRAAVRAVIAVAVVVLAFLLIRFVACSRPTTTPDYIQVAAGGMPAVPPGEVTMVPKIARVTLSAVGDNLIHDSLNRGADRNAGVTDDGLYDFTPMYEHMSGILAEHDINFIDMETVLGGDELGISGYPEFNTPECMASQLAACGWNLVTTATNHAWDMGLDGVLNNCEVWADVDDVTMSGTFSSDVDRATVRTFEREGITFSFLAYTDVINNVDLPITPEYAIAVADKARMSADIDAAKKVSDVVIVAMSWGDEDSSDVSNSQRELAQLMADKGVALVLGFGPHVIQPVEWVQAQGTDPQTAGHQTLVVYSLGNFISNQLDYPENVEGCFTCAFELDRTTGQISLVDPEWIPLVNHVEGDYHRVYPLSEYTAELAAKHDVLKDLEDPIEYIQSRTMGVLTGSAVKVVGLDPAESSLAATEEKTGDAPSNAPVDANADATGDATGDASLEDDGALEDDGGYADGE